MISRPLLHHTPLTVNVRSNLREPTCISASSAKCPIVLACDENYAMPLATMLRSLVEANVRHWPLDVAVLTDGFADGVRARVGASLPQGSVSLRWHLIDLSRFAELPLMPHISRITYARFDIENVFRNDVERVLYLDTDLLVLDDLGPLFAFDLGDHVLGAVTDDHIDVADRAGEDKLAGVPAVASYFNAGVLVIDLLRWRRHEIAREAIEYLARCPTSPYSDQDGLNVACDGKWAALDGRWNYQRHRTARIAPLPPAERPAVVHFITGMKPWLPEKMNPNARLYDEYRGRTEFRRQIGTKIHDLATAFAHRALRKARRLAGFSVVA